MCSLAQSRSDILLLVTVFKKGYENDLVQIYPSDVKIILKESVLEQFPCFDII